MQKTHPQSNWKPQYKTSESCKAKAILYFKSESYLQMISFRWTGYERRNPD